MEFEAEEKERAMCLGQGIGTIISDAICATLIIAYFRLGYNPPIGPGLVSACAASPPAGHRGSLKCTPPPQQPRAAADAEERDRECALSLPEPA